MEKKTLYALIAMLVLGVGAYAVLRAPEKGQRSGPAPRPVAQIKGADLATIEVTNEKQEKTVLEKKDGKWRVTQPKDWQADQAAVKTLTDGLEKLSFGDIVSEGVEKHADLGVADGKAPRLTLKDAKGTMVADLLVGKPVSGFTMLRLAGKNAVYQGTGLFPYMINREPKGWRDHVIFDVAQADVDKLTVDSGTAKLTLDKEAGEAKDAKWKIAEATGDAPKSASELDLATVNGTVQALSTLRAGDFADDKKMDDKPALTLTLGAKGKTHTLLVGPPSGEDVLVKRADDPQIYTVKKFAFDRANHRPADFRDKTLAKVKEDQLQSVDLTVGGETTTLTHEGAAWKGKGKAAVEPAKLKPVVTAFENLNGSSFSTEKEPAKTGLNKPQGTVALHLKDKSTVTIKIGALTPEKTDYYVQKVGSPDVLLVKKFAIDRFWKKPADLAKK